MANCYKRDCNFLVNTWRTQATFTASNPWNYDALLIILTHITELQAN